MKHLRLALLALGLTILVLPAPTVARPGHDRQATAGLCQALRANAGLNAFRVAGHQTSAHAYGKCVKDLRRAQKRLRKAAKRACRTERRGDSAAFLVKYGDGGDSYGQAMKRCVKLSTTAALASLQEARQTCATERAGDEAAFREHYGTNHNLRNAFGKCVSEHAVEPGEDSGADAAEPAEPAEPTGDSPNNSPET